ncbi:MAG: sigma 54-interacting transcriptional regulator [Acidobacteria bacterium]|nr:sigma 54-interacting transcriptional regulator [Acidobacteriota bacterium]
MVEAADAGTLLLDDVRDASPTLQLRLLRVRQAREVRRVGEVRLRPVDVRLIAATHRDLAAEVAQGRFRQDLYYRLRVVDVHVAPLRERVVDVGVLMDQLLARVASRMERRIRRYTDVARQFLIDYAWPEDVRELELAVECARTVPEQPLIDVGDLPDATQHRFVVDPPAGRSRPLREMEREHVQLIVRRHRGDRRRAAEELPISLATLKRKLIEARRPDTWGGQALLDVSPAFAQDARPLSTAFVARGLPSNALQRPRGEHSAIRRRDPATVRRGSAHRSPPVRRLTPRS